MPTATLQSTQPKPQKLDPRAVIGGTFEDIFETITGRGTGYVNEKPVSKQDFENMQKQPEVKASKFPMPAQGSIEFNKRQTQDLSQEIIKVAVDKGKKEALKARRAEVNAKIGIANLSYEDTVSEDFILRADVQADLDKANSELSQEQLKAKKENMIAKGTGKINRTFGADMNRNFEDQNMAGPG